MKTVLITGGGGSLGREFVRYLSKENVIVIDQNEWSCAELKQEFPNVKVILKDFVEWRFDQEPCDVIIHGAAYKHVSLGEGNPHTFIENNLTKTGKLFAEAYKNNVDIVFISSDKAVEPIGTYAYTKALGEKLCTHYNGFVVRLGNIFNSSGSVIPVWEKCISEGKPIPVSDERMKRYFIEAEQAVKEIWQGYLDGTRLIIPNCEELGIIELLQKTLERHNLTFKDIKIKWTGIKQGEKLREKLRWDHEQGGEPC